MLLSPPPTTALQPFAVALADTFDSAFHKPAGMFVSRKINGIRCIVHLQKGCEPQFYSKSGQLMTGLDELHQSLMNLPFLLLRDECVLDCELTLQSGDTAEDLNSLISQIQRKDHIIPNPQLHLLDLLTTAEFTQQAGTESRLYVNRMGVLDIMFFLMRASVRIRRPPILNLTPITRLDEYVALAAEKRWEGLILHPNTPYRPGRGQFFKIKSWTDVELPCIGYGYVDSTLADLQVKFGERSLKITEGLTPAIMAPYHAEPAKLLGAELTIGFRKDPLRPFLLAIHDGGRKV